MKGHKMAKTDIDVEKTLVSVDMAMPLKLSIIPIRTRPVFPGILMPLVIGGDKYIKTVENVLEKDGFIGMILVKNSELVEDSKDNC